MHEGAIRRKVELDWGTEDSEYLQKVELHCEGSLNELRPDIIVYNAGTDILDGDPLGGLSISPQVKRLRMLMFLLLCARVCCCTDLFLLSINYRNSSNYSCFWVVINHE